MGCKDPWCNPCGDFDVQIETPDKTVQVNETVTLRATAKSVGGTIVRQEWRNQDGATLGELLILWYIILKR